MSFCFIFGKYFPDINRQSFIEQRKSVNHILMNCTFTCCKLFRRRSYRTFIFGDILTVSANDILLLAVLNIIYAIFICRKFNSMLLAAIDEDLYKVKCRHTLFGDYLHIALLALIVIFTVRIDGVLLAGALRIVPAATARNLAKTSGSMFVCSIAAGLISGVTGLLISAQEWANVPAGAAIVMTNCIFFAASLPIKRFSNRH